MTDTRPAAFLDPSVFTDHYLAHASSQLPGRSPAALEELALGHLEFGTRRQPGEILVRWVPVVAGTAFQIVTADALFLVDSVRAALARMGHPVQRILHPQLVVERDGDGLLTTVHDIDDAAEVPASAITESWIYAEVERLRADQAEAAVEQLRAVLIDVQLFNQDADSMYRIIRQLADGLAADPGYFDSETSREAGELLRWLADGNFLALGHAAYTANDLLNAGAAGRDVLGVLRGQVRLSPAELLPAFRSGAPLVVFKSPLTSQVRRSARYDCVTVSTGGPGEGQVLHVFLGLLTVYDDGTVSRVPVVRRRIAEILLRAGVRKNSHTGRQLLAALRTLPRDELLEAPTGDLLRLSQMIVDRANSNRVGVFARTHLNRDFVTVLVYFAADRLSPDVRQRVTETVNRYWPGEIAARDDRLTELGFARMQFLIAQRPGTPQKVVERAEVEAEVARLIRRWTDDVSDQLVKELGTEATEQLLQCYDIPEAYKEDFDPATGAADLLRLERLDEADGLAFDIYIPQDGDPADRRLKVFRRGQSVSLARVLPIFAQMGVEVLDERPYELERHGHASGWIYDFGLRLPVGTEFDRAATTRLLDVLRLLWRDQLEQDGFNALVVRAGLDWWQVNVLRAYSKYLRQTGTTFSQGYIEQALIDNPGIARDLVSLFESRFDPSRCDDTADYTTVIEDQLGKVASLDQDRILRSLLALITVTLRTNAYRTDDSGNRRQAVAFKLDPALVPGLPSPRPRFEIWVYSPRVEGVHLRMGPVARGGLRWSDRREDFRTEILGLVKAQTVKNAVIVPTGAKGGFVCKRLPDPADRDAWLAEGISCYRTFIRSLLDLTDNYDAAGKVVHPPDTRWYDGDDPYLVVAADKGTATFSDLANAISEEYGFWLGDAFASGGSVGYDHKAMGITARGAWESVRYHFRELGVDTQSQDFTVVGIGDMSGDVFGNGMLLSEHIRLVAAFDHRHIFLDPEPDAATSFQERRRLFQLPRSSWDDYERSLLSEGGGIYPRTLKSIPITPQVARRLAIPSGTTTMTPNELIHAILTAPVDLLWNGGIGTYVKASIEPQAAVGDKANDGLRADATEMRCRVVGEGGNLGFTQLGRIEYVRGGGRMNTDAIDNSAGVDTSDHEVNIKILLDRAVAAGTIDRAERNRLLAEVADDVARLVLRDNYEQNVLLGLARRLSPRLVSVHERFIRALEQSGELDRAIEFLPSDAELNRREAQGYGLLSPESAVLTAYSKITLTHKLVDSTLPDEPYFQRALRGYFPDLIAERFADDLAAHPLQREIITTAVVNDMINRSGTTFVHRAREETGVDAANIARGYTVIREVFGLERLWAAIEALDNKVPVEAQHAGYEEIRRLIDRGTRWMVDKHFPLDDVAATIARYQPVVASISPAVPDLLRGAERDNLFREVDRLVGLGLPRDLALRIGELLNAYVLLDVVDIADGTRRPPAAVAELHFALSAEFSIDDLLTHVTALPRDDRWSTLARAAIRHDVYAVLAAITSAVLRETEPGLTVDEQIEAWKSAHEERVVRACQTVREALSRECADLATLSVALRVLRSLPG